MVEITVNGEKRQAIASVLTLTLYEQEFGKGLIEDLFGKVKRTNGVEEDVVMDFTNNDWTAMMRALWACLKTADDTVPCFSQWQRDATGLNLIEVSSRLNGEFQGAFFRAPDRTPEA